jgi:chitin disaccharide deacetylase
MSETRLVIQADDIGMCHAVNEGIERAFLEGVLTQTTAMAPCPWIDEAARISKRIGATVGMHATFTCEWDSLRWRPITGGASLAGPDGTFPRDADTADACIDEADAREELDAQFARLLALGTEPVYVDCHMRATCVEALRHVVRKHGKPYLYTAVSPHYAFDSKASLSARETGTKLDWMLEYLDSLGPGVHYLCTHPAEPCSELRSLALPGAAASPWAETYRASDLEILCDPRVRERIAARNIDLVSVAQLEPCSH